MTPAPRSHLCYSIRVCHRHIGSTSVILLIADIQKTHKVFQPLVWDGILNRGCLTTTALFMSAMPNSQETCKSRSTVQKLSSNIKNQSCYGANSDKMRLTTCWWIRLYVFVVNWGSLTGNKTQSKSQGRALSTGKRNCLSNTFQSTHVRTQDDFEPLASFQSLSMTFRDVGPQQIHWLSEADIRVFKDSAL